MGELVAWIIGWDLILEYAIGAATVAIGWSGYVIKLPRTLRHRHLPDRFVHSPFADDPATGAWRDDGRACINIAGHVIVAAVSTLLVVGVRRIGEGQRRHRGR